MRSLPLSAVFLADPLQSLDDVNLLGLVDLLRRVKDRRQLFIATHDSRFQRLLTRKLRPIDGASRTLVIEFTAWARQGPQVAIREIEADRSAFRIVA